MRAGFVDSSKSGSGAIRHELYLPLVIPQISIPQFRKYRCKLENKTSSGPDGINNYFKKAEGISLPKGHDKTNLTDYRSISLLYLTSVLLNDYLDKNPLIHRLQYAFDVNNLAIPP